jgi:CelD/BcsL family acetyltransferase involved in cellulose biosynthesis
MPPHSLTVRPLTLEEFRSRRSEYDKILAASAADPLFHSFDWLELWWMHLGLPASGEHLVIFAAEQDGRLLGVVPVVQNVRIRRGPLRYRSSAILGNVRWSLRGIPTEYTTVVAERGNEQSVVTACLDSWLRQCSDRELTVGWSLDANLWVRGFEAVRTRSWEAVRVTDPITAYGVDLHAGFQAFAASLSGNARRSMFNVRRKLEDTLGLSFHQLEPAHALDSLDRMNALHALRWKSSAFTGNRLAFHRDLIRRLGATNQIVFSEIRVQGRPISILYDIRCQGRQYNIQMGFDAETLPSASPGVIHLGFAIEEAAKAGVHYYDFLAGQGMQSDYKRRYSNATIHLDTVQYLRGPVLNLAARVALSLRRRDS